MRSNQYFYSSAISHQPTWKRKHTPDRLGTQKLGGLISPLLHYYLFFSYEPLSVFTCFVHLIIFSWILLRFIPHVLPNMKTHICTVYTYILISLSFILKVLYSFAFIFPFSSKFTLEENHVLVIPGTYIIFHIFEYCDTNVSGFIDSTAN